MAARTVLRYLRPLGDPTRIEYGIASSVVIGALSLIDPARLSPGWRLTYRAVSAGLTGGLTLLELRRTDALEGNPVAKAGAAFGVAGTVFGLSEVSERIDARITSGLKRVGVRRPRVFLAVASALTSMAAFRSGGTVDVTSDDDGANGPHYTAVDPALRELVDGMLAATPEHASEALRRQWAGARAEHWSEDDEADFGRWLEVTVDDALPRVVPYDFTFPVKAQFRAPSGVLAEASVLISGGRLRSVVVDVVPGDSELDSIDDGDPLETLTAWPAVHDVSFVLDAP